MPSWLENSLGFSKPRELRGSVSWRLEKIINKNSVQVLYHQVEDLLGEKAFGRIAIH